MIKTEMKGDTSRWCRREEAKRLADKQRRVNDRIAVTGERAVYQSQRKHTRQWCRGRKGVAHKLVVKDTVDAKPGPYADWKGKIIFCESCGKEFDQWWPRPWVSLWPDPPIPAWVTEGPEAYRAR